MEFINKTILGLSVRSWLCVVILIGSFLTVHGMVRNIQVGGHIFEYTVGIVISVVSIFLAAVPSKNK
ncbi:MAG: hypothetical protein ABIA63_04535 [bacterium]